MTDLGDVGLTLVTTPDDISEFQRWLGQRRPVNGIAFDLETNGFDRYNGFTRLIQFGDGDHGWAFEKEAWLGVARWVFSTFEGDFIGHNASFDTSFLDNTCGITVPRGRTHDTMVMSRLLEPHLSMALKSQASRYVDPAAAGLQMELKSTNWTWGTVPIDYAPYWTYAALDTVLTYKLFEHHMPIVQHQCPRAYEIEMAALWVTEKMSRNGTFIDREYTQRYLTQFADYCAQVEKWTQDTYGVKPGSNAAIVAILQEAGFTFTKETASGAVALDAEVLEDIDHPLARSVLNRRRAQKMASTYLKFYTERADEHDLIHPTFNTVGTRTGRMSSSDPNLQNLPRLGTTTFGDVVRNCVKTRYGAWNENLTPHQNADQAGTLLMCDFDQIEMRVLAHFSQEQALINAFKGPDDFFVTLARQLFADPTIEKKDKRRQITKNCVPLTTQILTRRGWLSHDEVKIGDETLGYDKTTGKNCWTTVTAIHHYANAEVFKFGNKQRSFTTTANHRWLARHNVSGELKFVTTTEQPGSRYDVILAAEAESGFANITPHEAAVLGWVLSDGSIKRSEFTGARSQAGGRRVKCTLSIGQTKPHRIVEIDELLNDVPHKRYTHLRDGVKHGVDWNIASEWGRSVLDRAGIYDKKTFDPWAVATSLSHEARLALIETLNAGDGGSFKHGGIMITQAVGCPVAELIVALGYLTGKFSRVYTREPDGSGWMKNTCVMINHQKPIMTHQRTNATPLGTQDVWCVTTELGTWTARENETPFLTGNSGYAKIYAAGPAKFALTAGIPVSQAREFMRLWDTMYPGVSRFSASQINEASGRRHTEGIGYVHCPITGRRHVADSRKEYAIVNYLIQGAAAMINKQKLIELDAAGLGDYMFATVHDEVLLDVPPGTVAGVVDVLGKVMNDDQMLTVPVTAGTAFGERWGKKQEWFE